MVGFRDPERSGLNGREHRKPKAICEANSRLYEH